VPQQQRRRTASAHHAGLLPSLRRCRKPLHVLSVIMCICASQKNEDAYQTTLQLHTTKWRTCCCCVVYTKPGFPGQFVQQTYCRRLLLQERIAPTTLPVEHIYAGHCHSIPLQQKMLV
jgi:hypothetical protein